MTVIQRVYLRAEKGTPVIHAWNVTAAAAAETATRDVLVSSSGFRIGTVWNLTIAKGTPTDDFFDFCDFLGNH